MEEQNEKKESPSGRRGFVRKLVGVVAASGLAGLLLGRSPQPALAATNTFPSDGNVGIGTLSPVRMLHIQGNNAVARLDRNVDSASFIFVRTNTDYSQVLKTFTFGVKATGVDTGSFFIGDMHTNVSGSSDNRLLIDTSGRVGIGTTSPSAPLHVKYASANPDRQTPAVIIDNPAGGEQTVLQFNLDNSAIGRIRADLIGDVIVSTMANGSFLIRNQDLDTSNLMQVTPDVSTSDGQTALLIRRNTGGTFTLQRVSMGPTDSGGTGYRVLRVPN